MWSSWDLWSDLPAIADLANTPEPLRPSVLQKDTCLLDAWTPKALGFAVF